MKDNNYLKNIKDAIHTMDVELLRDTLAYLLKVYVVDKDPASVGNSPVTQSVQTEPGDTGHSFAGLIRELKNRYTLPELNLFSLQGEKVYISLNNTQYQVTGAGKATAGPGPALNEQETRGKETIKENGFSPSGRFEKLELE